MIGRAGPSRPRGTRVQVTLTIDCDEDIDGPRWAALLAAVLEAEGVAAGAEAGLTFVTPSVMTELNTAHMGGDGPTDVLAFPIDGLAAAGASAGSAPGMVGDVVICPVVAWDGAADHAGSVDDELALLVVHGALHLLGHDHAAADERELMRDRERSLLAAHHGEMTRDPWS